MLLYCFSLLNADWACGWQGPPIADEKSDEDQDYIMPDDEPESEDGSFDSDEHVSVSQHFAAASSSSGAAAAGSSDPASGNQSLFADMKSTADDSQVQRENARRMEQKTSIAIFDQMRTVQTFGNLRGGTDPAPVCSSLPRDMAAVLGRFDRRTAQGSCVGKWFRARGAHGKMPQTKDKRLQSNRQTQRLKRVSNRE